MAGLFGRSVRIGSSSTGAGPLASRLGVGDTARNRCSCEKGCCVVNVTRMIVDVLWGFMGEGFWVPLYFMGVWAPLYFVGEGFGCLYVYGWIPAVFGVVVFGGGMGSIPIGCWG